MNRESVKKITSARYFTLHSEKGKKHTFPLSGKHALKVRCKLVLPYPAFAFHIYKHIFQIVFVFYLSSKGEFTISMFSYLTGFICIFFAQTVFYVPDRFVTKIQFKSIVTVISWVLCMCLQMLLQHNANNMFTLKHYFQLEFTIQESFFDHDKKSCLYVCTI